MDPRLLEAAKLGDVALLNKLLKEDPFLLEKSALAPTAGSPLHIAACAGKANFVREIVRRKPSFAWELNQDGFSPLHIGVAIGYEDVVQELLRSENEEDVSDIHHEHSSRLCLIRDKQGLIPLHYAAMKGRVTIIEELLQYCPESLKEQTTRGQTVLHLAVKNCQFEAFKTLFEKLKDDVKNFVDATDKDGNTIYQMAVASKQLQVRDYLEGHAINIYSSDAMTQAREPPNVSWVLEAIQNFFGVNCKEELLVLVAILIATVTYESGLSPPEKITSAADLEKTCTTVAQVFSDSCCATRVYIIFMALNFSCFSLAISIIIIRNAKLCGFLLPSSLICMILSYGFLLLSSAPSKFILILIVGLVVVIFIIVFIVVPFLCPLFCLPIALIALIMENWIGDNNMNEQENDELQPFIADSPNEEDDG